MPREHFPEKIDKEDYSKRVIEHTRAIDRIESPEIREKILDSLNKLIERCRQEGGALFEDYKAELEKTMANIRQSLGQNDLLRNIIEEGKAGQITDQTISAIEKRIEETPYCQEVVPVEELKVKRILKKAVAFLKSNLKGTKLFELALILTFLGGPTFWLIIRESPREPVAAESVEGIKPFFLKGISLDTGIKTMEEIAEKFQTNEERFAEMSKKEKDLLKGASQLIEAATLEYMARVGDDYYAKTIILSPGLLQKPIKVDGKIMNLRFDLPPEYSITLGNEILKPYFKGEEISHYYEGRGTVSVGSRYGSTGGFSQEKEMTFFIKDENGKVVGRFELEQTPAFLIDRVHYQNPRQADDSIGVYVTDIDTLRTFEAMGKENLTNAVKEMISGTIEVEEFFGKDLDIERWYLGAEASEANAYFSKKHVHSLFILGPEVSLIDSTSPDKEKMYRITGRHESIHKLDWLLGNGLPGHYFSNDPRFKKIYSDLIEGWEKYLAGEETDIVHIFARIKETNFYRDDQAGGHPKKDAQEFFESLLNIAMADREELKRNFISWEEPNRAKYIESLKVISQLIGEKGVDTSKLDEVIKFLSSLKIEVAKK